MTPSRSPPVAPIAMPASTDRVMEQREGSAATYNLRMRLRPHGSALSGHLFGAGTARALG